MSSLENLIWHIFGYATMPIIFIVGFCIVAAVSIFLLSLGKDRQQ